MAGTLGDLNVRIGANLDAFEAAMEQVQQGVGRLGDGLKSVGQSLTTYVTLPLAGLATAAVFAFGKMEALEKGLNAISTQDLADRGVTGVAAIGQAATLTADRLKLLQEIAKAPGIGFEQAVQGDIRLRAVGVSAEQSAKVLREFANAIALTGGGAAQLNSVTVQLGQLAAKGKVLAQDLRPIIEAAPSVGQALKKLFGTVDSEEISKQLAKVGQSSTDFIARLTDELAKAPRVLGGFNNEVENSLQEVQQDASAFGESLVKSLNLGEVLRSITAGITSLTQAFTSLSPGTQKLIIGLGAAVAAMGPLLVAVGSVGAALPAIVAGFEALGITSVAALGPIGIAAGAVAAAALVIHENWDELVAFFKGPAGAAFRELGAAVADAARLAVQGLGVLVTATAKLDGALLQAGGTGKTLTFGLQSLAGGVSFVTNGFKLFADLLRGDFTQAAADAEAGGRALLRPYTQLLGIATAKSSGGLLSFLNAEGVKKDIGEVVEGLTSVGIAVGRDIPSGGLLERLHEQLKQLKKDQQEAATEALALGFNAPIDKLEVYIKRLEGSDKAAKKAADAIAALRKELATAATISQILPPSGPLDVFEEKIKILEGGLRKLVDAGVAPSSRAFQGFVQQLVATHQEMDALLATGGQLTTKPLDLKLKTTFGEANPQAVLGGISQELANHPVGVPFYLKPLKTDFSGDILRVTQGLQKGLADASASAIAFGNAFDFAGARSSLLKTAIEDLLTSGVDPANAKVRELVDNYEKAARAAEFNSALTNSLQVALSSLGSAAYNVGEALATNQNATQTALQGLLSVISDFMKEYGQKLLLIGAGDIAIGNYVKGGLEIAAGIALLAGAGYVGGKAKSIGSSSAASSPYSGGSSGSAANGGGGQAQKIVVEFRLRGSDLVAVTRLGGYRELRTG